MRRWFSRYPDKGQTCHNCGSDWEKERVRFKERCPKCDYPFREYQTPLHTGEKHDESDYVDAEELVVDD